MNLTIKHRIIVILIIGLICGGFYGVTAAQNKIQATGKIEYGIVIAKTYDNSPVKLTAVITNMEGTDRYSRREVEMAPKFYMSLNKGDIVRYRVMPLTGQRVVEEIYNASQWRRFVSVNWENIDK